MRENQIPSDKKFKYLTADMLTPVVDIVPGDLTVIGMDGDGNKLYLHRDGKVYGSVSRWTFDATRKVDVERWTWFRINPKGD